MSYKNTINQVKELVKSWMSDPITSEHLGSFENANFEMLRTVKAELNIEVELLTKNELKELLKKEYERGYSDAY